MMNFKIIDNYFSESVYEEILNTIQSSTFPLYYQNSVTFKNINDNYFFYHILINRNTSTTSFNNIANFFIESVCPSFVYRMSVNAYPRTSKHTLDGFHVDLNHFHKVALWYANTNNGYTVLKDPLGNEDIEVNSVKNRMLLFDGNIFHSVVTQTDSHLRYVINMNYLPQYELNEYFK